MNMKKIALTVLMMCMGQQAMAGSEAFLAAASLVVCAGASGYAAYQLLPMNQAARDNRQTEQFKNLLCEHNKQREQENKKLLDQLSALKAALEANKTALVAAVQKETATVKATLQDSAGIPIVAAA
jgi:hypothetical protein